VSHADRPTVERAAAVADEVAMSATTMRRGSRERCGRVRVGTTAASRSGPPTTVARESQRA
jgi:hypothetical protein